LRFRAVAAAGLALLLVAGAGSAAVRAGGPGADRLRGTPRADILDGRAGNDVLTGQSGGDLLVGGTGRDRLVGGQGADSMAAEADLARDSVTCGPGRDVVTAELTDRVSRDCETVSRQLSRDTNRNPGAQHQTQVEPDSFSFGNSVVTTFQSGRNREGGAAMIGFATSHDGGRTWRSGFLPGVTADSSPPGPSRASDPVVAYDAAHRVWLIATLSPAAEATRLLISRSADGFRWNAPVVAAGAARGELAYDKEWIVCDNWPTSPFRGSCYLSYTDLTSSPRRLATQVSRDGGVTWSASVPTTPRDPNVVGAFPVVQPNGTLVVAFLDGREMGAARSTDNGASFTQARIAEAASIDLRELRDPPLPAADVDSSGRIYATWHDCQARPECSANDVVLATSSDGVTWSTRRVPIVPTRSRTHFVHPAVAVDPATAGARVRLGITYYVMPTAACDVTACRIDAGFVSSADGGATWTSPRRLTARSVRLDWIPPTTLGRMLADYISTSYVRNAVVAVFAHASPLAADGSFREAIFATRLAR
jgi:RTX calcium-binding nonapeptide repeat (4 copies)/BNR/Asp-box repeat